jgi:hypothetical protein
MNRTNFRTGCRSGLYAVIAGLALSLALPCAGFALGTDEQRAACTPDVFRLCSSEIPSVDRIMICLNIKKASLSPACKSVFAPAKAVRSRVEPVEY